MIDKMEIIINSTSKTSEKDMEDLRFLLEDIKDRFNFKWHINTYKKEIKS